MRAKYEHHDLAIALGCLAHMRESEQLKVTMSSRMARCAHSECSERHRQQLQVLVNELSEFGRNIRPENDQGEAYGRLETCSLPSAAAPGVLSLFSHLLSGLISQNHLSELNEERRDESLGMCFRACLQISGSSLHDLPDRTPKPRRSYLLVQHPDQGECMGEARWYAPMTLLSYFCC